MGPKTLSSHTGPYITSFSFDTYEKGKTVSGRRSPLKREVFSSFETGPGTTSLVTHVTFLDRLVSILRPGNFCSSPESSTETLITPRSYTLGDYERRNRDFIGLYSLTSR